MPHAADRFDLLVVPYDKFFSRVEMPESQNNDSQTFKYTHFGLLCFYQNSVLKEPVTGCEQHDQFRLGRYWELTHLHSPVWTPPTVPN